MFPNEYQLNERRKDLLREADQRRLAHEFSQPSSLAQRLGKELLKLSVALTDQQQDECYSVEVCGQVVTVCPA